MKKALCIGIDEYINFKHLRCCENDARSVRSSLEKNHDRSANFEVEIILNKQATCDVMLNSIKKLFDSDADMSLLYFSGHGTSSNNGQIVSYDGTKEKPGINMDCILDLANNSKCKNKIIILDCCHAGCMGDNFQFGNLSTLSHGVVILTASLNNELSVEVNEHGVFTNLLLQALDGNGSDLLGRVTPGGIYAYIDQSLGAWKQRPMFKANVSEFVVIKKTEPKIKYDQMEKITQFFNDKNEYKLDPSYEKTNIKDGEHKNLPPYFDEKNGEIFKLLQLFNRYGLVQPCNCDDMYFAAMESKSCRLTSAGLHYYHLVKNNLLK